jgi:hypothetical protein
MSESSDHLEEVGNVVRALTNLGFEPILVGGMALVILGSQRVTRDFDFVIPQPGDRLESLVDVFYDRGLELVSRLSADGEVRTTIDNRRVACIRLRLDAPASAYFFCARTGLRIDLLFDFPIAAATLADHATRIKIRSHVFHMASEQDLLRLKKIARDRRSVAADIVDIAFLEARRTRTE